MLLSDIDIKNFITSGDIKIEPFDEKQLNPASYGLSLSYVLLKPKPSKEINTKDLSKIEYEKIEIPEEGYVINPGEFYLGQIAEKISISQKLGAIYNARTRFARIGLNVLQGAVFVNPGQKESYDALEISNISQTPIRVYKNMEIVSIMFELLNTPAKQNYKETGNYTSQEKGHPEAK